MKKGIHPKINNVKFVCSTCGKEYDIESTNRKSVVNIDVCSNCHPAFLGGNIETRVKGRAEKLASKFRK
ncbi:MAG: 50S ribosomal protein L31 [Mycoplasmataceae bacterium]|jgi:large subunit ribosomal protein L31|nr:50S ribosomal protein L31 [Mycoplasmataceae bacterium]